ncbi:MAG: nucleotidyltransferase domain-containing protein [Betaproteobacteria bacterium]|nr:nucleotidyltransferase domain-containing protein [Betaproteobacteria bacterium]
MQNNNSNASPATAPASLEPAVQSALDDFVEACQASFRGELASIVLFGSAAEGRLRATSDVNVIVVLKQFDKAGADRLRDPLRFAKAAVDLNAMFVLQDELGAAMEAFALKFADIAHRHRVLFGADPFVNVALPRDALIRRLKQVLLNMQIRARERYILLSPREEQLIRFIADSAGPLRAAAVSLAELEGKPSPESPKAALESFVAGLNDPELAASLHALSVARETQALDAGTSGPVAMALMLLIGRLRERVEALQ